MSNSHNPNSADSPGLPEGLRVPLALVEGPTPAQAALAAHEKAETPPDPLEEALFSLFRLVEQHMHPDVSGRYGALLQDIAENQTYDGVTYLGLLRAPGGEDTPHGGEGGLVRHILRQWRFWERLRGGASLDIDISAGCNRPAPVVLSETWRADPDVTDEQVLQGIINDALPAAWAHYVSAPAGDPARSVRHESDLLLSRGGKAVLLLLQREIVLDGQMLHLLLPNPVQPVSALRHVLYVLSYLSNTARAGAEDAP